MGALGIATIIKFRFVLYDDAIEIIGIFTKRRVKQKDIGAKRFLMAGCPTYYLIPWKRRQRKIMIGVTFRPDEPFRSWMSKIPNADANFLRNRRRGLYEARPS